MPEKFLKLTVEMAALVKPTGVRDLPVAMIACG